MGTKMINTLNKEEYTKLLAETLPRVINTTTEHERLINEVEKLMNMGEDLTPEQAEVLELLVTLIEQFEDKHYHLKTANPSEILQELMLARGLEGEDCVDFFGSKGITSEVINGRTSISKNQAKLLGSFFHVSPALFL
jgi:HTH-type transcriptional regulator/antitoxin HigA